MRVKPDDEVYRIKAVWLGPKGMTFPWTARYLSYAVGLGTFSAILLFEALTPLQVHVPPVWEVGLTVLFTYWAMFYIDHERPIRSRLETLRVEVTAPRPTRGSSVTNHPRVRVRERRPKPPRKMRVEEEAPC